MHHSLEEQQNKLSPAASAELSERARTHKPPFCPRRTGGSAGQRLPSQEGPGQHSLVRDFSSAVRPGSVHLYTYYVTSGRYEHSEPMSTLLQRTHRSTPKIVWPSGSDSNCSNIATLARSVCLHRGFYSTAHKPHSLFWQCMLNLCK